MSLQPALSPAQPADAGDLARFAAESFRDTYRAQTNEADLEAYVTEAFSPSVQLADILDPATIIIVARDEAGPGRRMIGYMQMVARGDHLELKRLYVDQSRKGTGLAAMFVEEARDRCRSLGRDRLRLTVWTENPRAIAFYRKVGFVVTGSVTFMVSDDAQLDHVMELVVTPALPPHSPH